VPKPKSKLRIEKQSNGGSDDVTYQPRATHHRPADLHEIVWFHDADFDADEITFNERARTVDVVFDQEVRQLPSDLPLPKVRNKRRRWFGTHALTPFVECRLLVRPALGFHSMAI
jgi:hypothetical protein